MARRAQPWYRKDRGVWCVTINGKRHNLGTKKKDAYDRFHDLMRQPRRQKVVVASVASVLDPFLDWVERNRAAATYEWYRCRLQDFVEKHPQLTIEELRPHHVEKWAGLPHLAQTSRRNLMRAVKRSLKWAVAQGYLDSSPIEHMEVPGGQSMVMPPPFFRRTSTKNSESVGMQRYPSNSQLSGPERYCLIPAFGRRFLLSDRG